MKTFGHSAEEGVKYGSIAAVGLLVLSSMIVAVRYIFHAPELVWKESTADMVCMFGILPVLSFLGAVAAFRSASKYRMKIDDESIMVFKEGIEIERRTLAGFVGIHYNGRGGRWMEFEGEPSLKITGMNSLLLGKIDKYLRAVQEKRATGA